MTNDDLRIVRAVLRESARLSNSDAEALTAEIARRCQDAARPVIEPAIPGDYICDICHSKIRGPVGALCPFEHFPQGVAIVRPV